MHHSKQSIVCTAEEITLRVALWHISRNIGRAVNLFCKKGKGAQRYTVAYFDNVKIFIGYGVVEYRCNTYSRSCCCAHPQGIVITPLNVNRTFSHQLVENHICSWSSVEEITDDMQVLDNKTLYRVAQTLDKILCRTDSDSGSYNTFAVL